MKAVRLLPILLFVAFATQAQTLKIETAEKLFTKTSSQVLSTLKEEGFKNLSDSEVVDEAFLASSNSSSLTTKDRLYTAKGLKKAYELRKVVYGGLCKVSISMLEPSCKTVDKLIWNANLSYDTRFYIGELERLGYKRVEGSSVEKYINIDSGFAIIIKVSQRANVLYFLMNKI